MAIKLPAVALLVCLALVFGGVAHAQSESEPAHLPDALRSALAAKQLVFVRQADSDREMTGLLVSHTGQRLTLLRRDGTKLDIPFDRVDRIQRRGDSVLNGAITGALMLLAWNLLVTDHDIANAAELLQMAGWNALYGAPIGLMVDWVDKGRTTLYVQPRQSGGSSPSKAAPFMVVRF